MVTLFVKYRYVYIYTSYKNTWPTYTFFSKLKLKVRQHDVTVGHTFLDP
jgi:hypothetical protein